MSKPGVNILPFGRIRYPGRITCPQGRITARLNAVGKLGKICLIIIIIFFLIGERMKL